MYITIHHIYHLYLKSSFFASMKPGGGNLLARRLLGEARVGVLGVVAGGSGVFASAGGGAPSTLEIAHGSSYPARPTYAIYRASSR